MTDAVASIVRGEFVYRDTLLVDVGGDGKRHPRASPDELRTLLNGKASKDQVGHWYEAQLIHYGLQRSKEKNTAKVRLQQALGAGKFKVPPHIADMESQMKKDYAAAVRKAKTAASKATRDADDAKATPKSRKRKADDDVGTSSKKTKITVKVGDATVEVDQDAPEPIKKQAAAQAAKTSAKKVSEPKKAERAEKPPKTSRSKAAKEKDEPRKSAAGPVKVKTPTKPKANPEPQVKADAKVKTEPKPRAAPKIKSEPTIKRATPVKKEPKIEPDPMNIDEESRTRLVTGVYSIACPQLADQLPDQADNFRLFLCVDEGKIWGGFELAMKSGVMLTNDKYSGPDAPLSFGWRAKDSWENGRLSFGRGCFGELVFRGQDQVQGTFHNLFNEPMTFNGKRRPGPLWCGRSAYSFQQEWDGFVDQAYGR